MRRLHRQGRGRDQQQLMASAKDESGNIDLARLQDKASDMGLDVAKIKDLVAR